MGMINFEGMNIGIRDLRDDIFKSFSHSPSINEIYIKLFQLPHGHISIDLIYHVITIEKENIRNLKVECPEFLNPDKCPVCKNLIYKYKDVNINKEDIKIYTLMRSYIPVAIYKQYDNGKYGWYYMILGFNLKQMSYIINFILEESENNEDILKIGEYGNNKLLAIAIDNNDINIRMVNEYEKLYIPKFAKYHNIFVSFIEEKLNVDIIKKTLNIENSNILNNVNFLVF